MITHIIHGSDIPKTLTEALQKQLTAASGILKFTFNTVDDRHLYRADGGTPLEDLFEAGSRFRQANRIADRDFVIVLTEYPNAQNFYASLNPVDTRSGFVHAGDWEFYIDCARELPIAFTIVNLLVAYHTCPTFDAMYDFLHHRPIGCANDLCYNKREVIFKLRTGDVCAECIRAMQRSGWSDLGIDHAMRILSTLSSEMRFNRHFQPVMEPSGIHIDMNAGSLILPDYEFLNIPLTPFDLTYYLFYLRYAGEDGLYQTEFEQGWAQEALFLIYQKLRPLIDNERELRLTVKTLSDMQVREQARARIKKIFTSILGPRLVKPYLIEGSRGKPTRIHIPLTRVNVVNFSKWMELPERP